MSNPLAKYLLIAAGVGIAMGVFFLLEKLSPSEQPIMLNASSSSHNRGKSEDLEEEEDTLEEWIAQNEHKTVKDEQHYVPEMLCCKICLNNKRNVSHVFSCGHATCLECAVKICKSGRGCPFDRKRIARAPRPFLLA